MSTPKIHFSEIKRYIAHTITTTVCQRMQSGGHINCTEVRGEVTCKLCLARLEQRDRSKAMNERSWKFAVGAYKIFHVGKMNYTVERDGAILRRAGNVSEAMRFAEALYDADRREARAS
jgi:hypothetical protein